LAANLPHAAAAVDRWDRQTTPDRHRPCSTYYAGSVNNKFSDLIKGGHRQHIGQLICSWFMVVGYFPVGWRNRPPILLELLPMQMIMSVKLRTGCCITDKQMAALLSDMVAMSCGVVVYLCVHV